MEYTESYLNAIGVDGVQETPDGLVGKDGYGFDIIISNGKFVVYRSGRVVWSNEVDVYLFLRSRYSAIAKAARNYLKYINEASEVTLVEFYGNDKGAIGATLIANKTGDKVDVSIIDDKMLAHKYGNGESAWYTIDGTFICRHEQGKFLYGA